MKKIFSILIFTFLISESAYSDSLPISIFGIKINKDAARHVDLEKGKTSKERPGIISYFEKDDLKIHGLIRNDDLKHYYIRTDDKNKIKIVSGYKIILKSVDFFSKKNRCLDAKNQYIKKLSNFYDVDPSNFKNNFYKKITKKNTVVFYDSSELYYKKGFFEKYALQILCTYINRDKSVNSTLYISLADQDYFNSSKQLWTKIDKLDKEMILSNFEGF